MNNKSCILAYRAPNASRFLTRFEQTRRNGLERREDRRIDLSKQQPDKSPETVDRDANPPRRIFKISAARLRQVERLRRERPNSLLT
jgi:hypothetical protein